jgi:hypothetical protein
MSEEAMLEIARVPDEGTARLSSTITTAFVDAYLKPGDTERDVALRFAAMAKQLLPLMSPVLNAALAAHVREATRRGIISRGERESGRLARSQDVFACFADLVGFTSLGAELGAEELGTVARRFAELASEASSETVRLVKRSATPPCSSPATAPPAFMRRWGWSRPPTRRTSPCCERESPSAPRSPWRATGTGSRSTWQAG